MADAAEMTPPAAETPTAADPAQVELPATETAAAADAAQIEPTVAETLAVTNAMQVEPSAAETPATEVGEPQKPKRAASAYWIYSNAVREEVTKANKESNGGKAKLGDIAKEIASKWATLSETEKKVYEGQAAADKVRYEAELQAYKQACDPAGTLRKKHEHLIPKKPMTAYFLFSQDPATRAKAEQALRDAGQEAGQKLVASKLAEMWKTATLEEKTSFEERHKKEQAEFFEKQKAWQASPEFHEIEKAEKAQEEKRKQAVMGQVAEEAKGGKKRSRPAAGEQTPKSKVPSGAPASDSKRPRKVANAATVALDADVLAKAAKLGFEAALNNLAARPEVVASRKTSQDLLGALQASKGLVHPAKRALLGV